MGILTWEKPKRVMTTEEYNAISADSAPPGVYSGNMSQEDSYKWRAKLAGQRSGNLRVEIRKTVSGDDPLESSVHRHGIFAQLLIHVFADGRVRTTQNGAAVFTDKDWDFYQLAVCEARQALLEYQAAKR